MIVMLTQDLSKGFAPWKEMYLENKDQLNSLGGKLIFAGPHKDDNNKMMVLMEFDSPESMKAFAGHEELRAKTRDFFTRSRVRGSGTLQRFRVQG